MKSVLIASIVTAYIFTAQDPQQTLELQYKAYIIAQQFTPNGVADIKDRILSGKKIPRAAKQFLNKNIAWEFFAKSTLSSYWDKLNKKQKKEFTKALKQTLLKRYGKYFDANKKFSVKFSKPTEYKLLRGKQFAKVDTTISILLKELELDVDFVFVSNDNRWMLCDIYIDGISSSRNYRKALRRIFKKEGYIGVMSRLKKIYLS
tara:strand:- start:97 stop:708 length:612 start_codon:yes stop_codon:yes gene_type:complete